MKECNDSLGEIKGIIMFKKYSHIMSDKIRHHLQKKYLTDNYNLSQQMIENIINIYK